MGELSEMYEAVLNLESRSMWDRAESMKRFCNGDENFIFGEWRDWHAACVEAGQWLDPKPFKKRGNPV